MSDSGRRIAVFVRVLLLSAEKNAVTLATGGEAVQIWTVFISLTDYSDPNPAFMARRLKMASWVLTCPNCNSVFAHSPIVEDGYGNYFLPFKPLFPEGGLAIGCLRCRRSSTYQRADLQYQASRSYCVPGFYQKHLGTHPTHRTIFLLRGAGVKA
jgi:hypothetical protein